MSSRRRTGPPRSPTGDRSAKIARPTAQPLAPPTAVPVEPASTEAVAAIETGAPVAQALLSSVSIDAVEAATEPTLASAPAPLESAPSIDTGVTTDASADAVAPPSAEAAGPEALADGAKPETPSIEPADGERPDAIVVPMPSERDGQATHRPFGVPSPSLERLSEINATLSAFVRGEGAAAIAHFNALTRAGSPAEAIRLQVGEIQRAADASLTCFNAIVRSAHRFGETIRTP